MNNDIVIQEFFPKPIFYVLILQKKKLFLLQLHIGLMYKICLNDRFV